MQDRTSPIKFKGHKIEINRKILRRILLANDKERWRLANIIAEGLVTHADWEFLTGKEIVI